MTYETVFFLLILCLLHINLHAQSEDFNKVFDACQLAQSSMSYGQGSQSEIREATNILTKTP